jgi:acetyltransferase-like isoleucine patch superfamily enzyme
MTSPEAGLDPETGAPDRTGPSGVRLYARDSLIHRWRRAWVLRGVGSAGRDIFVERNVRLLRHPENVRLGDRVMLKEGSRICPTNPGASVGIGPWTTIGHHTFIFAMTSIEIGANCLIAPFCYLIDNEHGIRSGRLIREQPMTARPIRIGDDVWLGTGVVVTSGVTVADGAVLGARSVITDDVPANAIVVGVPGRVIGYREP